MTLDSLDTDELLHLGLGAMNAGRDADALVALKALVDRDAGHVFGRYLLAAQHAQMGMLDKAEDGFRAVAAAVPEFTIARFQLAQLLLTRAAPASARVLFNALEDDGSAIGRYSAAFVNLIDGNARAAASRLRAGLELPQEVPALASDMQRLLATLEENPPPVDGPEITPAASLFLSGYGNAAVRDD